MKKLSPAKEALLKQIREQRGKIEPSVLARATAMLEVKAGQAEPYDKKRASEIIQIFLKNHEDPSAVEKRLIEMLEIEDQE